MSVVLQTQYDCSAYWRNNIVILATVDSVNSSFLVHTYIFIVPHCTPTQSRRHTTQYILSPVLR